MPLSPGKRLGPYEVLSSAGAGGMGEVYRARDTRLDRTVAIKVLPEQFSQDPDLKQRFEREARAISSLNHPNICHLYDVGHQDGTDYLVMEFVEGETLSQRLAKGAMPIDQVMRTGSEIADALDKAHRGGIVHRDLKPGNIMLTKSGAKLLDFGLAKPAGGMKTASGLTGVALTQTSPASPITQQGHVVGTFQYMSPEQVEGREADARSDIFALGAVLYEMATGKRAFEGKSTISVASAILEKDPEPISRVQPLTPPAFEHVVQTCLAKDPDQRWQSAADVVRELQWAAAEEVPRAAVRRGAHEMLAWGVVAVLALALAVAGFLSLRSPAPAKVYRATLLPPDKAHFSMMIGNGPPMVSPDGTRVLYVAVLDGKQAIYLRRLDRMEATPIAGTENGAAPFWSPDGEHIGFFAEGKLWKTDVSGGPPVPLATVQQARGGSWGADDVILFAPSTSGPLLRVSANGGEAQPSTRLQTGFSSHRWPFFLPDGKHFIYLASITGRGQEGNEVHFASIGSTDDKRVAGTEFSPRFAQGKLLSVRRGVLLAQEMDPATGTTKGEPQSVTSRVEIDELTASALFSASNNSVLIYEVGSGVREQLTWFDRNGKQGETLGETGEYQGLALSPDGTRVALMKYGSGTGKGEIWLIDLPEKVWNRFSFVSGDCRSPVWSPDGKTIYFASLDQDGGHILAKPADGSRSEQELLHTTALLTAGDVTPDGKELVIEGTFGQFIQRFSLAPGSKPQDVLVSSAFSTHARLSPDSRWMAFQSTESGPLQVYVTSYPTPSAKYQVSVDGGVLPVWSRDGNTIYYLSLDRKVMSATVSRSAAGLQFSPPVALFATNIPLSTLYSGFVVTRDGRFLVTQRSEEQSQPLTLVLDWKADLKK